ncbi:MAG TPA: hypothetical protein VFK69_08640 [Candidatus Eisenbacteria bacterium]|nr:hypothetical protein [Candidatus Eisenbacteria bacterium]
MGDAKDVAFDSDARVRALERRVERLTALVGLVFLVAIVFAAWRMLPHKLAARGFVLADARGARRAELALGLDGAPMLRLNNAAGRARAMVFVKPDGAAGVKLADSAGVNRIEVELDAGGAPSLRLTGADGRSRVALGIDDAGSGSLVLRDRDLKPANAGTPPPR